MSNLLELAAKITLDTSSYDKGLSDSSSKMSGFGDKLKSGLSTAAKTGAAALTAVAGAATAVTTAITKMTRASSEHADEVDKQSQKLGLSRQAYQEWDYVLSQAGVEISSMSVGLKTLTNKIGDAKNGGEDSIAMFEKLGITMEDLQSLSREDIFKATIKGFQNMADSTDRAALANKLFGRSGQELTALFNETAESTDELIEKAHEYGMVMSDEAVQAGVDMHDSLDTLQKTFDGVKNNLVADFLPSLKTVIDGMTEMIAGKDGATEKISQGLEEIASKILDKTPELIGMVVPVIKGMAKAIIDNAPELLSAGGQVIGDIIGAIPEAMKLITDFLNTDSLPKLISDLCDKIIENIPAIIDAGVDLLGSLLNNVDGIIKALASHLGEFITSLVQSVLKNIPNIVNMGVDLLCHLLDDVDLIVEGLMDGVFGIIDGLFDLLTDPKAMAKLMLAGLKLGVKLIAGILKSVTMLNILEKIPVIGDLFKGLSNTIDNLTDQAVGNIDNLMAQLDADAEAAGAYRNVTLSATDAAELGSTGARDEKFGRGYVTVNINGDVKAEDVATEVENRLAGKMAGAGVA